MKENKKWALTVFVLILLFTPVRTAAEDIYPVDPEPCEEDQMTDPADMDDPAQLPEKWNKFRNFYYYGRIPESQQDLYRKLDHICAGYLTTKEDVSEEGTLYRGSYYTKFVPVENLPIEDVRNTVDLFLNDNPQYFFMQTSFIYYSYDGKVTELALSVYPEFVDGKTRYSAAEKIRKKLDAVIKKAGKKKKAKDKAMYVHNWIIRNNTYKDGEYDQSIYGVICKKNSVCAGYSKTFAACCNALGYPTICVTGSDETNRHMWNKTFIGKKWYNYDCTWDDPDAGKVVLDVWAGKSDDVFMEDKSHIPELQNLVPGKKKK